MSQYDSPGGSARGFLTGVVTARLSPAEVNVYDTIALYHDVRGRVVQSRGSNVRDGHDVTTFSLGLNGEVLAKRHDHTAAGRPPFTEVTSYAYDEWGKPTQVTHSTNGSTPVTLASYTYDAVGRLASKTVGGVETTNYRYNVRSWPLEADGPRFTERLLYNQNTDSLWPNREHEYRWDGKVAAYGIKAGGEVEMRGFRLIYDELGRLTEAHYGEGPALDRNYLDYDEKVGYDDMGNPVWITRRGQYGNGHCTTLDDITLTYDGNKVVKTSDDGYAPTWSGAFDFVDVEDEPVEYVYDQNGNMTKDLDRDIAEIEYNLLNLPTMITYQNGSKASYTYTAAGEKLRVDHGINVAPVLDPTGLTAPPASTRGGLPPGDLEQIDSVLINYLERTRVDYCGNMIYDRGVRRLLTDEGYVTFTTNGTPQYHYCLRDHLGNIRVVMAQDGTVEQKTHYYPFGGIMYGSTGQGVQPFKYGGKELDRTNGLDSYDFGARSYFADRIQWMTMDPLCEKYYDVSPYVYCGDDPINKVDPIGLAPIFNQNGDYLGTTKEGYFDDNTGMIYVFKGDEEINWSLFNRSDLKKEFGDNIINATFFVTDMDNDAKAAFLSKIVTNVMSQLNGYAVEQDGQNYYFNLNDYGGLIKYRKGEGGNFYSLKNTNDMSSYIEVGDFYNSYEINYFNIANTILYHEWLGHIIMGYEGDEHYKCYDNAIQSPMYINTTFRYKQYNEKTRNLFYNNQ